MKKTYWHAHNLPRIFILSLCLFSLIGMYVVEHFQTFVPQNYYIQKVAAAELAKQAFDVIKTKRKQLGITIYPADDPQQSGLIGYRLTSMTTDEGNLSAKQTSINPNIAAIFVDWLKQLNLKQGDVVAFAATGSFPALNISMLAAMKTLGLKPLMIYSLGSSQYGANILAFNWLKMVNELVAKGIFNYKPIGISLGGVHDSAVGISEPIIEAMKAEVNKSHFNFIQPINTVDSINKRMVLYEQNKGNQPIKAYINIGGGVASIGLKHLTVEDKVIKIHKRVAYHSLPLGVITSLPIDLANTDSVAIRFLKRGVPVINLHDVGEGLRVEYQLPRSPEFSPVIGWGPIFFHEKYNETLTIFVLLFILFFLGMLAVLSRKYLIRYIPSKK